MTDGPRPILALLRRKDGTYMTLKNKPQVIDTDTINALLGGFPGMFTIGEGVEPPLPSVEDLPTILEVTRFNGTISIDQPPIADIELPDIDLPDIMSDLPDPSFELPNIEIPDIGLDMPMEGIEFPSMGDMLGPCADGLGNFGDCGPSPGTGSGVGGMGPGGDTPPGGTTNAIGTGPTAGKETFDADKCFTAGTPYIDAINEISDDLGLDPSQMTVDGECDGEFENDKCFPKGSSKWDALWWISDQCGMQPLDPGDGIIVIAPPTPLSTTWTLNEYENLFDFTPELDGSELFAYVEVFRASVTQNGTVISTPLSVIVEVPTPFNVDPSEVFRLSVDPGVTTSEATALAKSTAARMGRNAYRITATTFFNPDIKLRHQIKIQRPSKSYEETFMCTAITHDLSEEGRYTTVEAQVILPDPVVFEGG